MIEFVAWPKTPRLSKARMVITEKIDGTNAAIGFDDAGTIWCQSRSRLITPEADNFGFARWAYERQAELFIVLGPGLHYGEWWGSGIQRGYGLPKGEKRFSLFNTHRFGWLADADRDNGYESIDGVPEGLGVVPVLRIHSLDTAVANSELTLLAATGSKAAPGFDRPEGICIFIPEVGRVLKMTFEGDDHKGEKAA